jgi:hypothetical protein
MRTPLLITFGIAAAIFIIMKKTWWDRLED